MPSISEFLATALDHHRSGRLAAAEQIYRQILSVSPHQPDAWHLLGVIAHQVGKDEIAVEYIGRAIHSQGDAAAFHNNLGEAYRGLRKGPQALAAYRRALQLQPDFVEAHYNLGHALHEQQSLDEAVGAYRRALELNPNYAPAHNNLGAALRDLGRPEEAADCCRRAVELKPDFAEAYFNLSNALRDLGRRDESIACCQRALQLRPDLAEAHGSLGTALADQGRLEEALVCYRRALSIKPGYAKAHNNLGSALREMGWLDEAVAAFRRAIQLKPDLVQAYSNLGGTLKDQGELNEALAAFRRIRELKPNDAQAHSSLLYLQSFCADVDAAALYQAHCRWGQEHAEPLADAIRPHGNDRSPERRLRVGYVSPDFWSHPVGRFILPLLEAHDRACVETYCYASVDNPDDVTDRCRAQAAVWRDVRALSDGQLADAVRQDEIDILVDLTMHMAGSRLLAFARKPAPVQVTYLAYCGTTGLKTIDYRLTDPYLDPPGRGERLYCEESVCLPETYWCYHPAMETPAVNALPAAEAGHVTFGCLNNFCKVSPPALAAWGRLLQAVPGSTLLLHVRPGSHRQRVQAALAQQGIAAQRVDFVDLLPTDQYFALYGQIDVALDTFPYAGGTTTCDALWMGVPVVSLAGPTAVGRGGLSILSNLGLPELVAQDAQQYVQIAAALAGDLPRLAQLRRTLRKRVQGSPLTDAPRFARHVEAAYRQMWRRWCQRAAEG